MTEEEKQIYIKQAQTEYIKDWREKNKDHIKEYMKTYRKTENGKQVIKACKDRYWLKKAMEKMQQEKEAINVN